MGRMYYRIALLILLPGAWLLLAGCGKSATDTEPLKLSGTVDVVDAELGFKLPGRIVERTVDEGQTVKVGQVVARLEHADLDREVAIRKAEVDTTAAQLKELETGSRPEEIERAKATLQRAQAGLSDLLAGSRAQEIAGAEELVKAARAEAEKAATDLKRVTALTEKKVMSQHDFDAAKAQADTTQARLQEALEKLSLVKEGPRADQIEQARQTVKEAANNYALVKQGPRVEEIEQARARLQQARESLGLFETKLSYCELCSPVTGLVLSKQAEPGEFVSAGTPVLTVGDLHKVFVRLYVAETDLGKVKVGQKVTVRSDTWPGKEYHGVVSFVSSTAEFTPKSVQTERERVKLVYRIKADVDNPSLELKPGMPIDAFVEVGQ